VPEAGSQFTQSSRRAIDTQCNLYSATKGQVAIRAWTGAFQDTTGTMPPMPGVSPDYTAPIVRNAPGGVRGAGRWGTPTPQNILMESVKKKTALFDAKEQKYDFIAMLKAGRNPGITNIRNTNSQHWKRWLGVGNRCFVPFTSFSKFNAAAGNDIWFAFDASRPLAVFAGIYVPQWTSVREVKEGQTPF
jgi:putative SOS response-associated peptidase YedK